MSRRQFSGENGVVYVAFVRPYNIKLLVLGSFLSAQKSFNPSNSNQRKENPTLKNTYTMAEGTWRSQGPPGVTRQASDRRVEPPLCIQNAMLTKDKKPFTYTPGGIDLSEIKSPRMARRIERNANAPGIGDMPRTSPPRGPTGPLPPAALAAMQSALPVQVLPAGAPPPPPPPPVNIPPPPPMEPLPTKAIATNEGVFERPDMTKIIPENPMALLRKTGGVNRRSFVEEPVYSEVQPQVYNQQNYAAPQVYMPEAQNRQPIQAQQPVPQQFRPVTQPQVQAQPQYTQPKPQMATVPRQEFYQEQPQEMKTSTAQLGSLYIPPLNNDNQRNITSPPSKVVTPTTKVITPPIPPQRDPSSPAQSPGSPQSPMATLNRAPRPWQVQKPPASETPAWVQRSQPSPPSSPEEEEEEEEPIIQSSPQINYQKRIPQSPGVQQNVVNQQSPQRIPQSPGLQQQNFNQQQRTPYQQSNVQPNVTGHVIIPVQMNPPPTSPNVEAVFVTQPIVLQHPGPRSDADQTKIKEQQQQQQRQQQLQQQQQQQYQQQQRQQQLQQQQQQQQYQQKTESKSTRIIPIQIEGAANNNVQRIESSAPNSASVGSATPGSAKTFNRQPSWSQPGPIQSNSFKILQKITNTDGEEDENEESTEHGPRRSQQFEQAPIEQLRKLKLNEDDQELMNKLKQGVDEENFLHKEVDPRYRGATIPSKAFKFLQSMTDSANQPATPPVPRNTQVGNQGPNVRTIPVQIEGEATGKPYVPPSEQTVPEPKKYTGGKIPSRSFKVLQAMTGETCGPDQSDM